MKLRIYRTWSWVLACSPYEVRYGGENPMKLMSTDVLQYLDEDSVWKGVEIVEEEKPKHPRDIEKEEDYKKWKQSFKHIKLEDKTLINLAELIRKS